MGKTYCVLSNWFCKVDKSGHQISKWCKRFSETEVQCFLCDKIISCISKGFAALEQHVRSQIHEQNVLLKLPPKGQMLLKCTNAAKNDTHHYKDIQSSGAVNLQSNPVQLFNPKDPSAKAEILWALKSIQCNMAVHSCDDLKDLFQVMFPGSVSKDFSLSHTKLSYLITEAFGPYFYKKLTEKVKNSFYTLLYDETTNNENKKELQIVLRFWDEGKKQIICRHLATIFMGHAKAKDIVSEIQRALSNANLSIHKMLMLGSDGPNVNKSVKRIVSTELIKERGKPLLDIGTCNIHIVHSAFLKGLEKLGDECVELVIDVYHFFKGFPSRQQDFEAIQHTLGVPKNKFIKHIPTRWLTVLPAVKRLIEQWDALENYMLKYIPSKSSELMTTTKYTRISKILKSNSIKVECAFVVESAQLFISFTERFQKTEPLIHILYEELQNILKIIAGRICKQQMINLKEEITADKLLPIEDIDCESVRKSGLSRKDKLSLLISVQKHYTASYNYLVSKKCCNLLMRFRCLRPSRIQNLKSIEDIAKIAEAMPFENFSIISLKDEWRVLQLNFKQKEIKENIRIDEFWGNVLYANSEPCLAYANIAQVVKAALCLSHGNADVERGFSLSGHILSEEKTSMSERMLNCRLLVRDGLLKEFDNRILSVPITKELMDLYYDAHRSYKAYLEDQKRKKEDLLKREKEAEERIRKERQLNKELAEKKSTIQELEKKNELIEKQKVNAQKSADALFKEANERLSAAIRKSDHVGIRVAQGLLLGAEEMRKEERAHEEKAKQLNKVVHKRKSALIDSYFKSKVSKSSD